MTSNNIDTIVNGWLNYYRATNHTARSITTNATSDELFQFITEVDELVRINPEQAWYVIQTIFNSCNDDLERACLAAGPLEDLLAKHGAKFIDRIEKISLTSSDFRELLTGVWRNEIEHSIWERIQKINEINQEESAQHPLNRKS